MSRYISNLGKSHFKVVKGILRYLSGTKDMFICFAKSNSGVLGNTNLDYVGNFGYQKVNYRIHFHIIWWCNILDVLSIEMCGIIYY